MRARVASFHLMDHSTLLATLNKIEEDDLYEFIYDLYVDHKPPETQHLGYVDKTSDMLNISLPRSRFDLCISQSLSGLSSNTESSSTGFICWQSAIYTADWILAEQTCPFHRLFSSDMTVLELGAGVGGVFASLLGPKVGHYVASDQKHILKLLKTNFAENVVSGRYSSTTSEKAFDRNPKQIGEGQWSKIDFIEFDWEEKEQGMEKFEEITGKRTPDIIIATDTIYNDYLIGHFLDCVKSCMGENTIAIIVVQLRDEDIIEGFLEAIFEHKLTLHTVPDHLLTTELLQGFMVLCLSK